MMRKPYAVPAIVHEIDLGVIDAMRSVETFVSRMRKSRAAFGEFTDASLQEAFADAVATWHRSPSPLSLVQYLGFTEQEYALVVRDPSVLRAVVFPGP